MWLMEQPLTIVFVGLLLTGAMFGGLVQSGKKVFLYGSIAMLLLTIGMVILERTTITPREAVKATLHVIARDLERNNVDAVVEHVSEGRADLREEARTRLAQVEIVEVKIKNNLKVDIDSARGMDIATATFNCVLRLKPRESRYQGFLDDKRPVPRFFEVRFKLEDGAWRIRNYEMSDPRAGLGPS